VRLLRSCHECPKSALHQNFPELALKSSTPPVTLARALGVSIFMLNLFHIPASPAQSVTKAAVRAFAYGPGRTDLDGSNPALAARHAT
jgi:hypothetical protein